MRCDRNRFPAGRRRVCCDAEDHYYRQSSARNGADLIVKGGVRRGRRARARHSNGKALSEDCVAHLLDMAMVRRATAVQDIQTRDAIGQRTVLRCQFMRISGVQILRLIELGVALS